MSREKAKKKKREKAIIMASFRYDTDLVSIQNSKEFLLFVNENLNISEKRKIQYEITYYNLC